jgi:uncharacterized membrane protein
VVVSLEENKIKAKSTLWQLVLRIWTVHVLSVVIYVFLLVVLVQLFGDEASLVVASIVVPIMYLVMTYLDGWRVAYRDRNMARSGRVKADKFRGVKAAAISQIPGIVLGVLCIAGVGGDYVGTFLRYFYMSVALEIQNLGGSFPAIYILPALLPFLSVIPGYALGSRDIRLVNKIVYTNKKED